MSEVLTHMPEAEWSALRQGADVYVTVTPLGAMTREALADPAILTRHPFERFRAPEEHVATLEAAYRAEGCDLIAGSRVGMTLRVPKAIASSLFGAPIEVRRNRLIREFDRFDFHATSPLTPRLHADLTARVAPCGGSFELEPAAFAPPIGYHHFDLPGDLARLAGVEPLHVNGIDGRGVMVAMIDTGFFAHSYYRRLGLSARRIPAVPAFDISRDERGHGTAMSAVLLAIAPGISMTMIKMADEGFSFPIASLQHASRLAPRIVNCSWGLIGDDPQVHLELANLNDLGITITIASGNGSDDRRTAMFQSLAPPWAISVGGAHIDADGRISPSDFASRFASHVFAGRMAPDLMGPCGNAPAGYLIVFPTEPNGQFDRRNSRGDGTRADDGWLVSSGTSAASAYVAGVAALLIQCEPALAPLDIKRRLTAMAEPFDGASPSAGFLTGRRLIS